LAHAAKIGLTVAQWRVDGLDARSSFMYGACRGRFQNFPAVGTAVVIDTLDALVLVGANVSHGLPQCGIYGSFNAVVV
jgi:hypothetical protein